MKDEKSRKSNFEKEKFIIQNIFKQTHTQLKKYTLSLYFTGVLGTFKE